MKKLKKIIKFRKISFDSKRLKHYGARKYKEYDVCQLEGCEKKLNRFGKKRRNKYCSPMHARKAKNVYKRLWELKNKDKVKEYKQKYNYRKLHTPEEIPLRKKMVKEKRRKKRLEENREKFKEIRKERRDKRREERRKNPKPKIKSPRITEKVKLKVIEHQKNEHKKAYAV
jgi:hypothetical protein